MKLFRKKEKIEKETIDPFIKEEIKKLKRKERKKALLLLEKYNQGKILRVDEDIDNKENLKE